MNNQHEFEGYWADITTGIVYYSKVDWDGSIPRDIYEVDLAFARRSALHSELVPVLIRLQAHADRERQLIGISRQRNLCMESNRGSRRLESINGSTGE